MQRNAVLKQEEEWKKVVAKKLKLNFYGLFKTTVLIYCANNYLCMLCLK